MSRKCAPYLTEGGGPNEYLYIPYAISPLKTKGVSATLLAGLSASSIFNLTLQLPGAREAHRMHFFMQLNVLNLGLSMQQVHPRRGISLFFHMTKTSVETACNGTFWAHMRLVTRYIRNKARLRILSPACQLSRGEEERRPKKRYYFKCTSNATHARRHRGIRERLCAVAALVSSWTHLSVDGASSRRWGVAARECRCL